MERLEKITEKAEKIYAKLEGSLVKEHKGEIIAIEVESGSYYIADSVIEAYHKGLKNHPGKNFIYKRIGFGATDIAFTA